MIDRTDNAKTNNLYSPPPNCWLFILDVDSDVFIIDIIIACLCEERERVNGWCVEVVRRVDGTSNQARSRRGPMLISEVMSQWRWSIGVVRPNDGGSLWCTIFYSGLELSGSSRKKWLLVASKPPITKLTDCPCSIYYGGELVPSG